MSKNSNKHVVLGLSGGVDSAVAAMLLLEQGYQVSALFMKNWEEDDDSEYCAAAEDLAVCESVCKLLDIKLHTVNFSSEYWDRVFEYFLKEYKAGRTPNPDVLCNKEIKFKAFLEHALKMGADYIATGHYAGVRNKNGQFELIKAKDENKDQTYFLHALGQYELSRSIFPLADILKEDVRKKAASANLPNYDRKDSTGICFIGERRFKDFLSQYIPAQPGEIRTLDGKTKGKHDGLMFHTIGQRQGLNLGGPGGPWYVASKDVEKNILYVIEGEAHPALFSTGLIARELHWINPGQAAIKSGKLNCTARIRHRQTVQSCTVEISENTANVVLTEPQRAVSPGQYIVFYDNEVCLGGGIIDQGLNPASNTETKN
jgi:tRNA-specific 2-thiouridylase